MNNTRKPKSLAGYIRKTANGEIKLYIGTGLLLPVEVSVWPSLRSAQREASALGCSSCIKAHGVAL
jgi:hypothetical protein